MSDSEDESHAVFKHRKSVNNSIESDTGDTPVARTTKRVTRVIESDESDHDMVCAKAFLICIRKT